MTDGAAPAPGPDPEAPAPARTLVVGIGAPDRGDDAIGPAVVARVAEWAGSGGDPDGAGDRTGPVLPVGTELVIRSDPTQLVADLGSASAVVIVDAIRAGAPAGTVHVLQAGAGDPPLTGPALAAPSGSHGFGVGHALELARALGSLPPRVVVVGVEAGVFEVGAGPTAEVVAARDPAARAVLAAVWGA